MTTKNSFNTLLSAGLGLSIAILFGRILGLGRELMIAAQYGAERTADQLILLLTFPDVMTNLLTAGAMTYVLVPEFKQSSNQRARSLFTQVSLAIALLVGLIAFVLTVLKPSLFFKLFAPGLSHHITTDLTPHLIIFGLVIPLTGLASVSAAWLHSRDTFALPALGTSIMNGSIIAALVYTAASPTPYQTVGIAVVAAAIVRYALQLAVLKPVLTGPKVDQAVITFDLIKRYGMALVAGGVFALFPVVARAFASYVEGGIATFNYGLKLAELPLAVAITVLPVILLPKISDAIQNDGRDGARQLSRTTLYATISIALAIGLPAAWFSLTIVQILFGWIGLNDVDIERIAQLAQVAFLALPAFGAVSHGMSVLNGAKQPFVPLVVSGTTLFLFIIFSSGMQKQLGTVGIMIALACSYYIAWILFSVLGANKLGWRIGDFGLSGSTLSIVTINLLLGLVFVVASQIMVDEILFNALLGVIWCFVSLVLARIFFQRFGIDT